MIADATGSHKEVILDFIMGAGPWALDVGCGRGEKTAFIARHVRRCAGIDPDADFIRAAHARHGGRNLQFQVSRAEALCFDAASFDAVFLNESLHHVPIDGQAQALRECRRVLKPRGKLLVTEPVHGSGSFGQTMHLYRDEKRQKQSALAAMDAAATVGFRLLATSEIMIDVYGYPSPGDGGISPQLKPLLSVRDAHERCCLFPVCSEP